MDTLKKLKVQLLMLQKKEKQTLKKIRTMIKKQKNLYLKRKRKKHD